MSYLRECTLPGFVKAPDSYRPKSLNFLPAELKLKRDFVLGVYKNINSEMLGNFGILRQFWAAWYVSLIYKEGIMYS